MSVAPIAVLRSGLVTAVGLDAPTACASMRAKLTNPAQTRFIDSDGEWIMGHEVPIEAPAGPLGKLAAMAALAIEEALLDIPRARWPDMPLLLCVAERQRPGRPPALDDALMRDLQNDLGVQFHGASTVVAQGRVAVAVALAKARELIAQGHSHVLVAAADSLLSWPTLSRHEWSHRLCTAHNSNGFLPGEGAGAVLLGAPTGAAQLLCTGIGFGMERAHIESDHPLRADGMTQAITAALAEAGCAMHDMDYRITDLSGEQYYFREASLALSRTLHRRKEEFDLWHPAECTGEAGAAIGTTILALADAACRKRYSKGAAIVGHMANDLGERAALCLHFRGA